MNVTERFEELNTHRLHDVFKSEASEFTPWLAHNLGRLSDAIGLNIAQPNCEQRLETMKVDIVAQAGDDGEDTIIIENQFGDSNHDHLGKLLCYAAYKNARYAVWIVERAREEHIKAIEMLNGANTFLCSFFFVEASVFTIGNSKPAIAFNVVCKPAMARISTQAQKTPAQVILFEFWEQFFDYSKQHGDYSFANRKPLPQNWVDIPSGTASIHYSFFMRNGSSTVRLLCDGGAKEQNKRNYHVFENEQARIEELLGMRLTWRENADKKASEVSITNYTLGGYEKDKGEGWAQQFAWLLDTYERFEKVFAPYIDKIKGGAS